MTRSEALQGFLDAALAAFGERAQASEARVSLARIVALLGTARPERPDIGKRLPVCGRHLGDALEVVSGDPMLDRVVERFKALEPSLEWKRRSTHDGTASENFLEGHANTMIVGPAALEDRRDVWIGATLMAPNVRYPDHDHAPEETYLVLSEGEFMHGDSGWFSPGVGGSFYNVPGIRHAMRSGDKPLFAFWALLPDPSKH
ncbi:MULTISPECIES: dimethylsulfonioproprionate lyase family protein [unclassified Rhizobium]|uniref:dimethylsulfonioproprionate lyase family protein n=1 Tax=unclassified Rhizobium TaxID=2613769 RepID=UPI000713F901|nr:MULTISPECIES: dimethylsulfonioproprionate lyase family protein [unclassified Rhizobium]KQS82414.1 transcriptional regulator [Rhizobium sp. Leaf386]KQS93370.1 transcriptional regulator [Rhizobium sp. Leaf391]KQT98821.1 transcriptional regulator [Rhizobium sp. Leaf453]